MDYGTRTHHSNQDTYDRLSEDDLKQAATIVASFVYNTAQREEMIPRTELPKGARHQLRTLKMINEGPLNWGFFLFIKN